MSPDKSYTTMRDTKVGSLLDIRHDSSPDETMTTTTTTDKATVANEAGGRARLSKLLREICSRDASRLCEPIKQAEPSHTRPEDGHCDTCLQKRPFARQMPFWPRLMLPQRCENQIDPVLRLQDCYSGTTHNFRCRLTIPRAEAKDRSTRPSWRQTNPKATQPTSRDDWPSSVATTKPTSILTASRTRCRSPHPQRAGGKPGDDALMILSQLEGTAASFGLLVSWAPCVTD